MTGEHGAHEPSAALLMAQRFDKGEMTMEECVRMLEAARRPPSAVWPRLAAVAAIAFGAGYLARVDTGSVMGASLNECVMRNVKGAATEFEAKAMYQMCTDKFAPK